jgi:transposase-like protein
MKWVADMTATQNANRNAMRIACGHPTGRGAAATPGSRLLDRVFAWAGAREPIAAIVRTIFAQPDHASAMAQLHKVAEGLRGRFPKAAALLEEAAEEVLEYRRFPMEQQRQLHSTNVLERLNKEIKRRSNVVGIFPSPQSTLRPVGAVLLEQDDEWAVADRRYFSAESMKQVTAPALSPSAQELLAAIG